MRGKGTAVTLRNPSKSAGGEKATATIPHNAIIDVQTLQHVDGPAPAYFRYCLLKTLADEKEGPMLTERRLLMLYYLCEGQRSPYLRTFPPLPPKGGVFSAIDADQRAPIPPLFWPEEEKGRLLCNTEIMKPLVAKEGSLRKEWEQPMRRWLSDLRRLSHGAGCAHNATSAVHDDEQAFSEFCWADSLFWTRVLQYSSEDSTATYHWVPLVDACNHSYEPTCCWSADKDGNVHLITNAVEEDDVKPQPTGPRELCYKYGHKPNAELLFSNGFCIDSNPHEAISWPLLEQDDLLTDDKVLFLKEMQLPPRICMRRQKQQFDFGEDMLGYFDLDSIYVLFLLVLETEELVYNRSNDGHTFNCHIAGTEGSRMVIETFDDFEEFCDDWCDALIPRVRSVLGGLMNEKSRTILRDTCYQSIESTSPKPREALIRQFLSGQLELLSEVAC